MIRLKILNVTTKKSTESCNSVMYAMNMFNRDEPQLLFVIVALNIARKTSNGWLTKWPGRFVTKPSRIHAVDTR